jgi:predicted outer membrane lipoprotein
MNIFIIIGAVFGWLFGLLLAAGVIIFIKQEAVKQKAEKSIKADNKTLDE